MRNQPKNYDTFVNSRFLFDVVLSILRSEMFGKDLVFIIIIYLSKNIFVIWSIGHTKELKHIIPIYNNIQNLHLIPKLCV